MGSRLAAIATAFDNVYSGWILWNLFLAFVPLLLSFWLFRPRTIPRRWLQVALGGVVSIGVIGLWARRPGVLMDWGRTLVDALTGDVSALLRLSWLVLVLAVVIGLWQWGLSPRKTRRPWLWWLGFVVFMAFLPNAPYVLTDIIHLIRGTRSDTIPAWVIALVFVPIHITAIALGFEAYVISILNVAYYLKQQGARAFILPMELTIHALCAVGIYLGRFIRFNSWDLVTDPLDVLTDTLNILTSRRPLAVVIVTFGVLTVLYWLMKQITLGLKLRIHYARQGMDALD
ncbi:hypothetical protein GFS31_35830 [Leptolyngbya sp. BL0902]|uniref:DUF1361 domain-containing protein n=1 Tax=Leptolyngbya sp. BL0902 TaxID=1115757 RepID=UPI0018E750F6|nr:DUF1361 domain-containing protein [Leptolyngbya sp. BL0902]QQE66879.1 hypothetical protein GFS31_35830 [Leptolyngbya sp. BL0902]